MVLGRSGACSNGKLLPKPLEDASCLRPSRILQLLLPTARIPFSASSYSTDSKVRDGTRSTVYPHCLSGEVSLDKALYFSGSQFSNSLDRDPSKVSHWGPLILSSKVNIHSGYCCMMSFKSIKLPVRSFHNWLIGGPLFRDYSVGFWLCHQDGSVLEWTPAPVLSNHGTTPVPQSC